MANGLRFFALALAASACSDALEEDTTAGQVIVVLNATDLSLSLVDATDFQVATAPLSGGGTPTTLGARESAVLVPLGNADAVQVLDLAGGGGTTDLAAGSGATGAAVANDSLAWVANPGLQTATLLDYRTGDTVRSVAAGVFPQAVAVVGSDVFIVNGNLVGGAPAGPSWITATTAAGGTGDSLALTGTRARSIVGGADGLLYVVSAGDSGAANGRVSVVDPATKRELVVINGLGESPGSAVYHPSGRLLVTSLTEGILEINTSTRSITRGPGNGIKPTGDGVAALALD
ncbi:MAG: hypothetical protein ACREKB_17335, partial [Candidatus Rokuibacteriota bacterium]